MSVQVGVTRFLMKPLVPSQLLDVNINEMLRDSGAEWIVYGNP
jgi:hypothetical protein